ncbi:MAG: aldo/keto reductase [Aequorivita antarctica]
MEQRKKQTKVLGRLWLGGKVFENEVLETIAKKHNRSVSQVCLRWIIQHEVIVIPKATWPRE